MNHFKGLKWIVMQFLPLFLLLCVVSLVLRGFCRFRLCKHQARIEQMFLRPRGSKKIAEEDQNDPTKAKSTKQDGVKTQRSRSDEPTRPEATTAWLWWPPRAVVAATAVAAIASPGCFDFFAAFCLPRRFFGFGSCFVLKRACIWTLQFHSFYHSSSSLELE